MIRQCRASDAQRMYFIINKAAEAYEGVIPPDRYQQPYMSMGELREEMERATFYGWVAGEELVGIMGMEPIKDVTLIRHAYVLPEHQRKGIATKLLDHIKRMVKTSRLLVGTWADASWAISFYQKHGFHLLPDKDLLLKTYWDIPRRQIETSVVLGIDCRQA
ncbi:MAG TPA: GNAT family N-acetyltransferase [Dehalococcoidia bacterium]|nr:GNAT family N-acetyltransferase [Dehalococcoidia bacterium]